MASTHPFTGKVIGITGAASGIGLSLAHYLAARGAGLSLADLQEKALSTASSSLKSQYPQAKILTYVVDVRKLPNVAAWIQKTISEFGRLDGAANFAGVIGKNIGVHGIAYLEEEEFDFVMAVNCKGIFNCLKEEMKVIANGGSIVNCSSIAGLIGFDKNAAYVASKHAVIGLTRSAAKELGEKEVRCNCICPGTIQTPMMAHADEAGDAMIPAVFKRRGQPEEVAALTAYLLGDESKFTTGAIHSIDGGWNC